MNAYFRDMIILMSLLALLLLVLQIKTDLDELVTNKPTFSLTIPGQR
jgi:hypothetical protein